MPDAVKVGFAPFSAAARGILVVFCDEQLKLGSATRKALGVAAETIKRAAATNQFKGKSGAALDILAPEGIKAERLIVIGAGKPADLKEKDFLKFGGLVAGKLNAGSAAMTVIAELPDAAMAPGQAAAIATGIRLRAYKFDRYKTRKKDGEDGTVPRSRSRSTMSRRRGRRSRLNLPSSTASTLPASSSTSRRTCCIPKSSRAAPASCASSASPSRCSTSRR